MPAICVAEMHPHPLIQSGRLKAGRQQTGAKHLNLERAPKGAAITGHTCLVCVKAHAVHMAARCALHMPWRGCPCWWDTLSHVEGRFQLVPGSRAQVELVELASS